MTHVPTPTIDSDVLGSAEGATLQSEHLSVSEVKKRSLKGVGSFLIRTILLTGVTFIAQLILGVALSPADYGIYGLVVTLSSFFTIISDVGLAASLIQKKETPTVNELRTVFTVQQLLAWLVCLLIFTTALIFSQMGKLSIEGVLLAGAFGISFPIVSLKTISSILLERQLHFDRLVVVAIIETVVFNAILVPLALQGFGVMSFTYAVIAKAIVGVIVMFFVKRWPIGLSFSFATFNTLMRVGGAFQLNDMLAKAKDDLFYITLSLVISPGQYGYVTWAKQWSRFPYSLTVDNITALTFPAFSRLQHDPKLLRRAIEKTIFMVTLIAFPLFGGLSVMMIPFIQVIPRYEKWAPAIVSLMLFSFSLAFAAVSTPLISTLNALGKITKSLQMMVFWTISQWVLFPILFPYFGYESVAIISGILAISSLYVVRLVQGHIPFDFIDSVWRQTVATIGMIIILFVGRSLWAQNLVNFGVGIASGASVFLILMCLFGFEKMKGEILSLLRKK